MRALGLVVAVVIASAVVFGVARVVAQDEAPTEKVTTLTMVERAEQVTVLDLGEEGASAGDVTVWGPNPFFDETNTTDTGATTQGSCHELNADGDALCIEMIVFEDGSTLAVQGVRAGGGVPSSRTIIGGTGAYLGVTGSVLVEPSEDRSLWTETFEIIR